MSLFNFGFTKTNLEMENESQEIHISLPSYIPEQTESGLGWDEHDTVTTAVVDLANSEPDAKRRKTRGKYADQQCAKIGKYSSERGNERARRHFLAEFPGLRR